MSSNFIGTEILPNIYIDNVRAYDNNIRFTTYVFDRNDQPAWSDNDIAKKNLRIKTLCCFNRVLSEDITNGNVTNLLSLNKENSNILTDVKSVLYCMKHNIADSQHQFYNHTVYKQEYSFPLKEGQEHASIFAFLFIEDKSQTTLQKIELSDVYGPISSVKVLEGNLITPESFYFVNKQTGKNYNGPVHYNNEGGWMIGSRHTVAHHSSLERNTIGNYKVKDLRTKRYTKKTKQPAKKYSNISDSFLSFNHNSDINGIFFINLIDIMKQHTKYGFLLENGDETIINDIMSKFRIKSLTLFRNKIKSYIKTTFIGTKRESRERLLKSEEIGSISQRGVNEFQNLSGIDIRPLNLQLEKGIICLDFLDKFSHFSQGEYQYHIEMFINDPTVILSYSLFEDIKKDLQFLEKYHSVISNKKYYDSAFNKPKDGILDKFFNRMGSQISLAARNYVKYKSFFCNLTNAQKRTLEHSSVCLIHPKTCSIESLGYFIKLLRLLQKEAEGVFTHSFAQVKKNKQQKRNPMGQAFKNNIYLKHQFNSVTRPHENIRFYNYLQKVNQKNIKVLTKEDFMKRVSSEKNKFFISRPNFSSRYRGTKLNTLSDIDTGGVTYLSPFSLNSKTSFVRTRKLDEININKFNEFFYNYVSNVSGVSAMDPNQTNPNFSTTTQNSGNDTGGIGNPASDYLGIDSTFNTYEEQEDFCNINNFESSTNTTVQEYFQNEGGSININPLSPENKDGFFDQYTAGNVPIQTIAAAALILSGVTGLPRSSITVNLTWQDLARVQTLLFTIVNFFKLNQIEKLVGFKAYNNKLYLNQPVWKKIDMFDMATIGNGYLLRQEPIKNNYLNSIADKFNRADISYSDKHFVISDLNLQDFSNITNIYSAPVTANILQNFNNLESSLYLNNSTIVQKNTNLEDVFSTNPVVFNEAADQSTESKAEFDSNFEIDNFGVGVDRMGNLIGEY